MPLATLTTLGAERQSLGLGKRSPTGTHDVRDTLIGRPEPGDTAAVAAPAGRRRQLSASQPRQTIGKTGEGEGVAGSLTGLAAERYRSPPDRGECG